MGKARGEIVFDHKGIGQALRENRLVVPINQRSYAWEEQHVTELFQDFANAASSDDPDYFLGTIVLTQSESGLPEVTDGQQRLATATVLLAAIRDYLHTHGNVNRATSLSNDYLLTTDLRTEEVVPRLTLNVDDSEYFVKRVLSLPESGDRYIQPMKRSHYKIDAAAKLAAQHIESVVTPYREDSRVGKLIDWVDFIRVNAKVILVKVPDHINAFTMFETLNDRGLRIAQSDLLKNYLFGKAGDKLREVQPKWASMTGALETIGGDEDLTVTYIRHLWITKQGHTRERDLSQSIKDAINSKQRAVDFSGELADSAQDYVAIMSPDHEKWNEYGNTTRRHIRAIVQHLRVEQIRPLMLAVAKHFSVAECKKAFRLFVCWSVRFLVVGGRGGLLDTNYAKRAQLVGTKEITTAVGLAESMADVVPNDAVFQDAFTTARVSQNYLARYYLRALELQIKKDKEPELIPNEDQESINLEHVLPEVPATEWGIDAETAAACHRRLGNMVLLQVTPNATIGNAAFLKKRSTFKESSFFLTKMVADSRSWGLKEINGRQRKLAELAIQAWPLKVR
jgi:hypothetical protein